MKLSYLKILLCAISCSLATLPAAAKENESTQKPNWFERLFSSKEEVVAEQADEKKAAAKQNSVVNGSFSEADRKVIEQWQQSKMTSPKHKKHKALPPGLKKKLDRGGELPPGWKKKLEVGNILDPEVDKAASKLPDEILKRLPEIPAGTEILQVGDEVIRVIENTREIVGIFEGWTGSNDKD
jgi:hypothetical protein